MNINRNVVWALLAALLFGASTPMAKHLTGDLAPLLLAGLLYLGSGVGLMLTRSAIEQLGGRLTLINPEDGGALARIELPRQPAALTP